MFWDTVAGVYDLFANVYNRKVHASLCAYVEGLISPEDVVLECACGTGMLSVCIAPKCARLTATDFSEKMLVQAKKKCGKFKNVTYENSDITALSYPDASFDKVIAGNVIHLVDEPLKALAELDRVCRPGGQIIIPTYMNRKASGKSSAFVQTLGKAGADFKRQFSFASYRQFFEDAGYAGGSYTLIEGRVSCAVAVLQKTDAAR